MEVIEGDVVIWKPPELETRAGYHAYSFSNGCNMIICPDTLVNGVEVEFIALDYTTEGGSSVIRQITTCFDVQGQLTEVKEIVFQ